MKIAIVGAGVSGPVAAHLLAPKHEITVFEAEKYAGGHTNTPAFDSHAFSRPQPACAPRRRPRAWSNRRDELDAGSPPE